MKRVLLYQLPYPFSTLIVHFFQRHDLKMKSFFREDCERKKDKTRKSNNFISELNVIDCITILYCVILLYHVLFQ